jgi:hypothetical protein
MEAKVMRDCLRVIHAADLALNEPLGSVGVLPSHHREIANQARERVALRVFETARSVSADLLLLTGRLADFAEAPRLSCFLAECFRQLQVNGIKVAWLPDRISALAGAGRLLQDVLQIPVQGQIVCELERKNARVLIADSSANSSPRYDEAFRLSIRRVNTPAGTNLLYTTPGVAETAAHPVVAAQPDGPFQDQAAGIWMTDCISHQVPRPHRIASAAVGWATEIIEIKPSTSEATLLAEMLQRCRQLQQTSEVQLLLIHWQLTGAGPLWDDLIGPNLPETLLQRLRFPNPEKTALWTRRIELLPSEGQLAQWARQPALALAFEELEQISAGETANGFCSVGPAMPHYGSMMNRIDVGTLKLRLVRELRLSTAALWSRPNFPAE